MATDCTIPGRAEHPVLPHVAGHMKVPVTEAWGKGKPFRLSILRIVCPVGGDFHPGWAGGGILRAPGLEGRPYRRPGDSFPEEVLFMVRALSRKVMLGVRRWRRVMRRMKREQGVQRRRRGRRIMGVP